MSNAIAQPEVLTIVELEARFETTAAAADSGRCSGNDIVVKAV